MNPQRFASRLDALTALADAQRDIDAWDHEFTTAPIEYYSAAEAAIDAFPKDGIVAFLSHTSPPIRREAAKTCRRWRYLPAHDALVAALGDDDQETRDAVAHALVEIGARDGARNDCIIGCDDREHPARSRRGRCV